MKVIVCLSRFVHSFVYYRFVVVVVFIPCFKWNNWQCRNVAKAKNLLPLLLLSSAKTVLLVGIVLAWADSPVDFVLLHALSCSGFQTDFRRSWHLSDNCPSFAKRTQRNLSGSLASNRVAIRYGGGGAIFGWGKRCLSSRASHESLILRSRTGAYLLLPCSSSSSQLLFFHKPWAVSR